MRAIPLSLLLACAALASGCVTNQMMLSEPIGSGRAAVFEADFFTVLGAAKQAALEADLDLEKTIPTDSTLYVLLYKKGTSGWSWGEKVRIVVAAESTERTRVEIVSRRKVATNITAKGNYADQLFEAIGTNIQIARRSHTTGK